LRADLSSFLLDLSNDLVDRPHFDRALVQGFPAINGASYDDIRAILAAAEAADFLALR
jgi:hypothetical protein